MDCEILLFLANRVDFSLLFILGCVFELDSPLNTASLQLFANVILSDLFGLINYHISLDEIGIQAVL